MERAPAPPCWRGQRLEAVLFDLDGTLVDTAADIALALDRALAELGLAPPGADQVRRMIGRGAPVLIERAAAACGRVLADGARQELLARFLHHCEALELGGESSARCYAGAAPALAALHGAGLRTAVVTNKQQRFAAALLERLELSRWIDLTVGGDSCERRKPDPQPLLWACTRLGSAPARSVMVGDSINDVLAARAAGIGVLCVPYGYNEGGDPRALPCDLMIEDLLQLPRLLLPHPRAQPAGTPSGTS